MTQAQQAEQHEAVDTAESLVDYIPWVLPVAGAILMFLLAFIAVTMA